MRYYIVREYSNEDLTKVVNDMIAKGWRPHGSPVGSNVNWVYSQAMIHPDNPDVKIFIDDARKRHSAILGRPRLW